MSISLSSLEEVKHMANKAQLIETVAEKTGLTKKDATVAVDAVFGSILMKTRTFNCAERFRNY